MDLRHALIVLDESHLDQTQGMQLDQFLTLNGLDVTGDPSALEVTDTYFVSVSATPYSELSSIAHHKHHHKHVERLLPGDGYVGIRDYIASGLIDNTYSIVDDEGAFGLLVASLGNKYFLMRLSASKTREAIVAIIQRVYTGLGGRVFYHDSKHHPQISIDALREAPDCPTIVLLDGMLRVGKVVPKRHIGCVWENSKAPNTDVIVQGLLGRMCGYPLSHANPCGLGATRPRIFLPEPVTKSRPNKVVVHSDIERAIMNPLETIPSTGSNLKKGVIANKAKNDKHQCTPLRIPCTGGDWSFTDFYEPSHSRGSKDGDLSAIKKSCVELLRRNTGLVRDSEHYTAEQKDEIIQAIVNGRDPSVRLVHGTSQLSYFKELQNGHCQDCAPSEHISDCPPVTVVVPYKDVTGAGQKYVYVIFYTNASSHLQSVHMQSRIPKTNGKSIYDPHVTLCAKPKKAACGTLAKTASITRCKRPNAAPACPPHVSMPIDDSKPPNYKASGVTTSPVAKLRVASQVHDVGFTSPVDALPVASPVYDSAPLLPFWTTVCSRIPFEEVKRKLNEEAYLTPSDFANMDADEFGNIATLLLLKQPEIRRFQTFIRAQVSESESK